MTDDLGERASPIAGGEESGRGEVPGAPATGAPESFPSYPGLPAGSLVEPLDVIPSLDAIFAAESPEYRTDLGGEVDSPPARASDPSKRPVFDVITWPVPVVAPEQDIQICLESAATYEEALKHLHEGRYSEASVLLERLCREQAGVSEYVGAAAFARFKMASDPNERLAEALKLGSHSAKYPFCVMSLACAGRMYLELGRPQTAARYLKAAVDLEPSRLDLIADLRRAHELLTPVDDDDPTTELITSASLETQLDAKQVPIAVGVYVVLWGLLFYLGIEIELGRFSDTFEIADEFFWIRLAILTGLGLLAARLLLSRNGGSPRELGTPPVALVASILAGALIGAHLPILPQRVAIQSLLVMSLSQALAEEVFFRFYLGRALERGLVGVITPSVMGGVLYGLYLLTSYGRWIEASTLEGIVRISLVGGGVGTVYALLHRRTGSLVVASACHLTAAIVVAVASA